MVTTFICNTAVIVDSVRFHPRVLNSVGVSVRKRGVGDLLVLMGELGVKSDRETVYRQKNGRPPHHPRQGTGSRQHQPP